MKVVLSGSPDSSRRVNTLPPTRNRHSARNRFASRSKEFRSNSRRHRLEVPCSISEAIVVINDCSGTSRSTSPPRGFTPTVVFSTSSSPTTAHTEVFQALPLECAYRAHRSRRHDRPAPRQRRVDLRLSGHSPHELQRQGAPSLEPAQATSETLRRSARGAPQRNVRLTRTVLDAT